MVGGLTCVKPPFVAQHTLGGKQVIRLGKELARPYHFLLSRSCVAAAHLDVAGPVCFIWHATAYDVIGNVGM